MSAQSILPALVLLSLAANLGDRVLTGRPGFLRFPRSGALRYVFGFWTLSLPVLAVLNIFQAIPATYLVTTGTAWFVCAQCYDIWRRHCEPHVDATTEAVVMQSTWSPFQSPEVRDICAHLTAAEKQHLLAQAVDYGRETAWRSALPGALVFGVFFLSRPAGFVLLASFIIYCITVERQRIRTHQQRVREFLAATEFAREHGYKPDTLRMFAFPWSR